MIRNVKFASIPVRDQGRALEFFRDKLGFSVYTDQPFSDEQRWIELTIGGSDTRVVLFTPEAHRGWIGGFSNITFACDDVEKTYRELKERGVEFVEPPKKEPWGIYALFKDPDGTTFCLSGCR
jgi:predicted enzyme related to lactoylglutathione lyase